MLIFNRKKLKRKVLGFSLFEVLVVLSIIGLVIISVPSMFAWLDRQGVLLAVDQLRSDLQLARMTAIRAQQPCAVDVHSPEPEQYTNSITRQTCRLSGFRGGVHFLTHGPDGRVAANRLEFNRQGMSTTVVPRDLFLADRDIHAVFRIRITMPGGISVSRWTGDHWN